MNRRSFFQRANGLVAAIAVSLFIPAERLEFDAPKALAQPQSDLWFTDSAIERGDGPTGWYHRGDGKRRYLLDGVEVDGPEAILAYAIESWSAGMGVDYDGAYSVYTETDGYALPAGGQP